MCDVTQIISLSRRCRHLCIAGLLLPSAQCHLRTQLQSIMHNAMV